MNNLKSFSVADGHIKSILVRSHNVEIVYQRWDNKQFNLVFHSCFCVKYIDGIERDIGEIKVRLLERGTSCPYDQILDIYGETNLFLAFIDSWNEMGKIVELVAASVDIVPCCKVSFVRNINKRRTKGGTDGQTGVN